MNRNRTKARLPMVVFAALAASVPAAAGQPAPDEDQLAQRVVALEQRVNRLEHAVTALSRRLPRDAQVAAQQAEARKRMKKDGLAFTPEQLRAIEALYQKASGMQRGTAREQELRRLVETYPASNRAGCARLYLAQDASSPNAAVAAFEEAIARSPDCFYGDGVQVGAYARYLLGRLYQRTGRDGEAARVFGEIRTSFPGAVDHDGRPLVELIGPQPGS